MSTILGSPSVEESLKFNIFEIPSLKETELLNDLNTCFENGKSFRKIYDYTAQKEKEIQLKILSEGLDNSPASVVVTNAKGEISFVNEKFVKINRLYF